MLPKKNPQEIEVLRKGEEFQSGWEDVGERESEEKKGGETKNRKSLHN